MSWDNAKEVAKFAGGRLAVINTLRMNHDLLNRANACIAERGGDYKKYWIVINTYLNSRNYLAMLNFRNRAFYFAS